MYVELHSTVTVLERLFIERPPVFGDNVELRPPAIMRVYLGDRVSLNLLNRVVCEGFSEFLAVILSLVHAYRFCAVFVSSTFVVFNAMCEQPYRTHSTNFQTARKAVDFNGTCEIVPAGKTMIMQQSTRLLLSHNAPFVCYYLRFHFKVQCLKIEMLSMVQGQQ